MRQRCTTCKKRKDLDAYAKDQRATNGRTGRCKRCVQTIGKAQRLENPLRQVRERLRAGYGMTIDDWRAMFNEQHGRCGICDDPMPRPLIDHDYRTARVRGLLCFRCNSWLAPLEDLDFVAKAQKYLALHADRGPENAFYKNPKHLAATNLVKGRLKQQRHARWSSRRDLLHPVRHESQSPRK